MVTITITGEKRWSDALLKADILKFESKSRLVLAPTGDTKVSGCSTTLVIMAGEIDIVDHAVITWDLDGSPGDPPELVYDPDTPAPNNMSVAAPGFNGTSFPGEGPWSQANPGGNAGAGHTGAKGTSGLNAPELQIFVGKVNQAFNDAITVNFKGQDGGRGGTGGKGGTGGNGQKGGASQAGDSWYDGDQCNREPGRGGNGGKGGNAGFPGLGGAGGNGGIIKVFATQQALGSVQTWNYIKKPGKGAPPGVPGQKGPGGAGGPQGDQNDPCPSRPEYAGTNGPAGLTMDQIDPNWNMNYAGKDGVEGDLSLDTIDVVPI